MSIPEDLTPAILLLCLGGSSHSHPFFRSFAHAGALTVLPGHSAWGVGEVEKGGDLSRRGKVIVSLSLSLSRTSHTHTHTHDQEPPGIV